MNSFSNNMKHQQNDMEKLPLRRLLAALLLAGCVGCLRAANPYLPLWEFIPDGEPYVFEDPDRPGHYRVYVYGSHDTRQTDYCGLDQVVWSAPVDDLRHWRCDGVAFASRLDRDGRPLHTGGEGDVLFAPDVAMVTLADGRKRYYLYPNNQAGGRNGMVAVADRPDGPFKVVNWSGDAAGRTDGVLGFDPAVFVDDDGRVYGYWGFERSYGAELDPHTMATVKPGTAIVEDMVPGCRQDRTFRFFEASSIRKVKGKYVFVYSRKTYGGEFGLPASNYTLAYAWADSPLGPFHYGGTIIDGRGRERGSDGTVRPTAHPNGNTHGSIVEINGQWYVFYHRQCGTDEYSRQAMVAPINVKVTADSVIISEAEYTSEGFETDGLDPLEAHPAGIACYYTHPKAAREDYPRYTFHGSYPQPVRASHYGEAAPYAADKSRSPLVNNTTGSIVGYKYFNFSGTHGKRGLALCLTLRPNGIKGEIGIHVDSPHGKRVATVKVPPVHAEKAMEVVTAIKPLARLRGKHALYLSFDADVEGVSLCELESLRFSIRE